MSALPQSIRAEKFDLRYDIGFFSYDKKKKTFYTDAANLGWEGETVPEFFGMTAPTLNGVYIFDLMEICYRKNGTHDKYVFVCERNGAVALVYNGG